MKRASSLRLRRPKPIGRSVEGLGRFSMRWPCSHLRCRRGFVLGGPAHRADDVLVAGAAADGARDRGADLVVGRVGVLVEQGARRSSACPGVQNPHCSACRSWKPCWIGSSLPSTSSDSTVRTSWPSHIAARVVHDLTGWPSISTTQAPQLEVSQPQCVPVRSERLADEVDEQQARLDVVGDVLAVDGHRDVDGQASCSGRGPPRGAARAG